MHRPIHSDFLIHWTGKDIDKKTGLRSTEERDRLYLKRLKFILKYGLWMTKDKNREELYIMRRGLRNR